jgi:hypothetical protein
MVTPVFDELIHPSTRLSIVAILASTDWADSLLCVTGCRCRTRRYRSSSRHWKRLGISKVERAVSEHRRRVRVALTETGHRAFEGHVAALQAVIAGAEGATV